MDGSCDYCPDINPNCIVCSEQECEECQIGYTLQDGECIQCLPGCLKCSSPGTCQVCLPIFFLNYTTGHCQQCSNQLCLYCPNDTCTQCVPPAYAGNDNLCYYCSQGCSVCFEQATCQLCASGYYMKGQQCLACQPYCESCEGAGWNCTTCIKGFYRPYLSGPCMICPAFCPDCLDPSTCLSCTSRMYLSNGQCLPCST